MKGRGWLCLVVVGLVVAIYAWLLLKPGQVQEPVVNTGFDRFIYVCTNDDGDYSPGVYEHGAAGGGQAALAMLRDAAPVMRAVEVGDAAAGLCGYIYSKSPSPGVLSLQDAPKPDADGKIDWEAYCGWNVDVILINLSKGTAECLSSTGPRGAGPKVVNGRVEGLKFHR